MECEIYQNMLSSLKIYIYGSLFLPYTASCHVNLAFACPRVSFLSKSILKLMSHFPSLIIKTLHFCHFLMMPRLS